jgi:hypothetical protein
MRRRQEVLFLKNHVRPAARRTNPKDFCSKAALSQPVMPAKAGGIHVFFVRPEDATSHTSASSGT